MNATQNFAVKSAGGLSPFADDPAAASAQTEQRAKNRRSFQAKCDAMLYIVEFIATFHLRNTKSSGQTKKMEELKSLVAQTRNELDVKY